MSGLVGYASSDEEEDDIQPSKPAKIAKTEAHDTRTPTLGSQLAPNTANKPSATATTSTGHPEPPLPPTPDPSAAPGPSAGPAPQADLQTPLEDEPPSSPYTTERAALRSLTMPTHPNFSIPSSPSPPPPNSEEAFVLSTTTKKFERFLALKQQGVHFNERLESNTSLRNPGILPKLMQFAGIREEESHASTLAVGDGGGGVPVKWPEEWYVENLVRENERREKKVKGERKEVGFVKAKSGAESRGSSKAGTPKGGSEHRKSKFERR